MAFIRSYSQRGQLAAAMELGDPGIFKKLKKRLRVPKAIRKFQPGKAIAKLAPIAAGFIPGVGPLAALAAIAQRFQLPLETVQQLAEFSADQGDPWTSSGWDYGDPGKKAPKRKRAAAGTKTKAKNKGKGGKKPGRRPSGSRQGIDWAKLGEAAAGSIPIAGGVASEVLRQINEARAGAGGGLDLGAASATLGGGMRLPRGARGFGGGRRHMNPTNVKALRRSIRRVEGFRHLVKRVEKSFPAIRTHRPCSSPAKRGKGRR